MSPKVLGEFVRRRARRWVWKCVFFAAFTAVVLNPNLPHAWRQIQHTLAPEGLIQTDFQGIAEANHELDRHLPGDSSGLAEIQALEKFVYKRIHYVTDYENWGNMEYWPAAREVWEKKQEDCDGRAIFAASLLRSRGYPSAKLAVGLDHMWVQVDANEKNPALPKQLVAILHPSGKLSLAIDGNPRAGHFLNILKTLLHPRNLIETTRNLIVDIPVPRQLVLLLALLALCYHPCRNRRGFLMVALGGLASVYILVHWPAGTHPGVLYYAGLSLLGASLLAASLMNWLSRRRLTAVIASPAPIPLPPATEEIAGTS